MDSREMLKGTIKFLFEQLKEEKNIKFNKDQINKAIEEMHDDYNFLDELLSFFEQHIEMFGENYGLDFEEE